MKRAMTLVAMAALVSTATVACGSSKDSSASGGAASGAANPSGSGSASAPSSDEPLKFQTKDANTVVLVDAVEYSFKLNVPQAAGPKVFFIVKNAGKEKHEFEILGPDGKHVDEIPSFNPDLTKNLAVELAPGTYTFQCILETNGKTHASLGMTTKYTIT